MNSDKCFTVWWNSSNGLFLEEFPEDNFNFLFNNEFNINEKLLNKLIEKSKETTKITPSEIVIDKIIRGDAGDNIYPIILRKPAAKSNSTRMFKVAAKDIDYSLDYKDDEKVKAYIHNLINSKNYIGRIDKSEEDIIDHFKYNRRLVALEKDSYPKEVLETFDKYKEYNVSKNIKIAESQLQAKTNQLQGILDII